MVELDIPSKKSFENVFSILVSTDKLQNLIAYVGNLNLSARFEIEEILLNSQNIYTERISLLLFLFILYYFAITAHQMRRFRSTDIRCIAFYFKYTTATGK